MSNLDNIVAKILDEGRAKAEALLTEAKEEAAATIEARTKAALEEKALLLERARREAEQLKEKAVSNAELRTRDDVLKAKQSVVAKVIEAAKEKLVHLDDDSYIDYIKEKLQSMNVSPKATLLVPKAKMEAVQKADLGLTIREGELESGFAIEDGHLLLNNDFRGLVDVLKDEFEGEIVQKLFTR